MIGKSILHYEIREKLGEGGMGEVFLARDTKLDRDVALKFLPPTLQQNEEAKIRLMREAQAASKLVHPNIVGTHAIEEVDGRDFIVMEFVKGRPLSDLIAEDSLTIDRTLELAGQLAGALSVAHAAGVVHRDIKSNNILIAERGEAKMLDFGLATFHGATQVTKAGSTLGTVAYMSPEQAQGHPIDYRSDLFSLGVVIYEMITGRRPFEGENQAAIVQAILHQTPEPLARYKADVPNELEHIVSKALRKVPAQRYQGGADMIADLETVKDTMKQVSSLTTTPIPTPPPAADTTTAIGRAPRSNTGIIVTIAIVAVVLLAVWLVPQFRSTSGESAKTAATPDDPVAATAPPQSSRIMLAVLPFENLGAEDDTYFSDGITEEITARLAKVDGLGVIARTSVLQYKKTTKSIGQIGGELGVDYILEGTVRWQRGSDQSRVRVTPQLIKVADATHVWADVYDQPMTEVFDVQTTIAKEVVRELDVTLLDPVVEDLERKPTENMEAYDSYLRARNYFNDHYDEPSFNIAQELFEKAIALDPDFILAHCDLARLHAGFYWFHFDRTEDRVLASKQAAQRAVELDPSLPEARAAMGWYYYHGRSDYDNALREFNTALRERPNSEEVLAALGFVYRRQGLWEKAYEELKKAAELSPRSGSLGFEVGQTAHYLGRVSEAKTHIARAIDLSPDQAWSWVGMALIHFNLEGDVQTGIDVLKRGLARTDGDVLPYVLSLGYRYAGDFDAAVAALKDMREERMSDQLRYHPNDLTAGVHYFVKGDGDRAKSHLQKALGHLEEKTAEAPDDPRYHGALGLTYAGLGRRDDAIREGKQAIELQPLSVDAFKAPGRRFEMAQIYTMLGEADAALDEIEFLLSIPAETKSGLYRIDPLYEPLRNHPRWQTVVGDK